MTNASRQLAEQLKERFGDSLLAIVDAVGEVTIEVPGDRLLEVATALRDEPGFAFEILIDLCGIDYANFGRDEWATGETTGSGFSRGVEADTAGRLRAVTDDLTIEPPREARRFAAVYHLLSVANNRRLRMRVYAPDDGLPVVPSVIPVWNSANWYEREAFDLYGILFEGHPDLRRLLTDYGFVGHPFRKDFPLSGNVEVIYDAEKGRVVYQPVSIEPRVLVPKVVRAGPVEATDLMAEPEAAEDDAAADAETTE
ncbi:MAG TPA: NADH-quinone oxidoreductase subunit C [Gammaproteobacteria bacterium]|nr:NADH-quinone oxidoreductase subunit C [Gammaproteobacteria bacterium]